MTEEETKYAKAWEDRRRRGLVAVIFGTAGILYGALICARILVFDGHKFLQPYILPLIIAIFAVNWYVDFRCPRCGKRFLVGYYFKFFPRVYWLAKSCVHCGLERGAKNGADTKASENPASAMER